MRTEDLISALAADNKSPTPGLARTMLGGLAVGVLVSLIPFLMALGVRSDFMAAVQTWRFDLKIVLVVAALLLAAIDCVRAVRPLPPRAPPLGLITLALLAVAVTAELLLLPRAEWQRWLIGSNALMCLAWIPALSAAPLAILLFAMKAGAPASPARAGAAVGVLAAAAGATLYAFHCFDDSPLFVATWYSLAAIPIIVIGAAVGGRMLRW